MNSQLWQICFLCAALTHLQAAATDISPFSFGVVSPPLRAASDNVLQKAIKESDTNNLAFVVANGIKTFDEACSDSVYNNRKAQLQGAKNGLVVSLAASDWTECKDESGKSTAVRKLNHLRELFFIDEFSLGATKIPVIRQSTTPKFRNFPENVRWEMDNIMFATIHLPSNNNHFVFDAGRNSEFEDRSVANRDWLYRVFTTATRKKMGGIVLFSDGNPLARTTGKSSKRDGFVEIRRHLFALIKKFPGKVLLIHGRTGQEPKPPAITWRGNLGEVAATVDWLKFNVDASNAAIFSVADKDSHHRGFQRNR